MSTHNDVNTRKNRSVQQPPNDQITYGSLFTSFSIHCVRGLGWCQPQWRRKECFFHVLGVPLLSWKAAASVGNFHSFLDNSTVMTANHSMQNEDFKSPKFVKKGCTIVHVCGGAGITYNIFCEGLLWKSSWRQVLCNNVQKVAFMLCKKQDYITHA